MGHHTCLAVTSGAPSGFAGRTAREWALAAADESVEDRIDFELGLVSGPAAGMWLYPEDRLEIDAPDMALEQRRPEGVIHHSDQGSQYTSIAFGRRPRKGRRQTLHGLRSGERSSVGNCYDKAMCESFFATLECELITTCTGSRTCSRRSNKKM